MQEIKALVVGGYPQKAKKKEKWRAFMNIYNTMEHKKVVWGFMQ